MFSSRSSFKAARFASIASEKADVTLSVRNTLPYYSVSLTQGSFAHSYGWLASSFGALAVLWSTRCFVCVGHIPTDECRGLRDTIDRIYGVEAS